MSKQLPSNSLNKDPNINKSFLSSNFRAVKKIGEGSFGKIYECENAEGKFAMKLESRNRGHCLLESEGIIMTYLKGLGIPFIKAFGKTNDFNVLIMELLGKSLEDIFSTTISKVFKIKTVCNLAVQIITIWEYIHAKHIIHQDIKPDNFVMGINQNADDVYIIDFGLAKKYRSSQTLQHYPMTNNKKWTGTARYASVNAWKGIAQSRRDDWEATGYVLLYLLRGSWPWQGLPVKNHEDRYQKIMEKKRDILPSELCCGFPKEIEEYIYYTKGLGYETDPDYNKWRSIFEQIMKNSGGVIDRQFEWNSYETNTLQNEKDDTNSGNAIQNKVTVVNNYYSNVNNIVITAPEDKPKILNKPIDTKDNWVTSTVNMFSNKNYSNVYNSQFNDPPSKRDHNLEQSQSIGDNLEIKIEKENKNCCCSTKRTEETGPVCYIF